MTKKRYSTLLFDLDNTLLDFSESETKSLDGLYDAHFAEHLPKTAFLSSYHEINQKLWRQVSYGECRPGQVKTERFKQLVNKFQLAKCEKALALDYESLLVKKTDWMPGAKTAIDQLKPHYQIGIITNGTTNVQKEKCLKSGISDWCDCIIISEETGYAKPNPAIFNLALNTLQTQAENCLMFGDSLHSDHQGAINSGMDFCWVKYRQNSNEPPLKTPRFEVEHISELINELLDQSK